MRILNRFLERAAVAGITAGLGIGVAFVQPAAAQGAGGIGELWGIGAIADLFNLGSIPSYVLYMLAAVFFCVFVVALMAKHRQNHMISWGHVMVPLIASALCVAAPALITAGSQTVSGQAPGITSGTAQAPINWQ
jgi:hypothetical protein